MEKREHVITVFGKQIGGEVAEVGTCNLLHVRGDGDIPFVMLRIRGPSMSDVSKHWDAFGGRNTVEERANGFLGRSDMLPGIELGEGDGDFVGFGKDVPFHAREDSVCDGGRKETFTEREKLHTGSIRPLGEVACVSFTVVLVEDASGSFGFSSGGSIDYQGTRRVGKLLVFPLGSWLVSVGRGGDLFGITPKSSIMLADRDILPRKV